MSAQGLPDVPENSSFYRLRSNLSNTSLESEALLDHRDHPTLRTRRPSVPVTSNYPQYPNQPFGGSPQRVPPSRSSNGFGRSRLSDTPEGDHSNDNRYDDNDADDRTPLMSSSHRDIRMTASYGGANSSSSPNRQRRPSRSSMSNSRLGHAAFSMHHSQTHLPDYDVNNPPSVPTSPVFETNAGLDDVMLTGDLINLSEPEQGPNRSHDALIDIDGPSPEHSTPTPGEIRRRMTTTALEDVCFPHEAMSELGTG